MPSKSKDILNKLREKWKMVDVIQENHVQKLYANSERIKKEFENKDILDKTKVEIVDTNPEDENQGVTPISPDIEDYSLLDKSKVDIVKNENTMVEETINKLFEKEDEAVKLEEKEKFWHFTM